MSGLWKVVGATGVEPARIAPKDPKSFASANSATRPNCRAIFATALINVNTFQTPTHARGFPGIACRGHPGTKTGAGPIGGASEEGKLAASKESQI
jgi:hypothetical protein